jgi:hypothetical protein
MMYDTSGSQKKIILATITTVLRAALTNQKLPQSVKMLGRPGVSAK